MAPATFNRSMFFLFISVFELSLAYGFLYKELNMIIGVDKSPFLTAMSVFLTQGLNDLIIDDKFQQFVVFIQLLALTITFIFFATNISNFFKNRKKTNNSDDAKKN